MASKANLGKWAEAEVRDVLVTLSNQNLRFAWHRYPDSRSARNLIQAQPADFLVADSRRGAPVVYHLEVKETAQKHRLPKDKVSQWADLRKFSFAGIQPYVLVYRSEYSDWVFFDNTTLIDPYDTCPPSFPFPPVWSFSSAAIALNYIFNSL
jgi:hypothetical protein